MQQQDLPDLRAAQRRFALTFAPLFLLSLGAHVLGGGNPPAFLGVVAGLLGAALVAAILARMTLTVTSVTLGAIVAQIVVHGSLQFLNIGAADLLGSSVGRAATTHTHHAVAFVADPAVTHANHSMFTAPMLLAHAGGALCLAFLLVRLDAFLEYAQSIARPLLAQLQPAALILRERASLILAGTLQEARMPAFLAVLAKRGPPPAFGF